MSLHKAEPYYFKIINKEQSGLVKWAENDGWKVLFPNPFSDNDLLGSPLQSFHFSALFLYLSGEQ